MGGTKGQAVAAALGVAALLTIDVVLEGPLSAGDLDRLEWMAEHRSGLVSPAEWVTELGNYAVLLGVGAAVALVLWRQGRRLLAAAAPLLTLLVSGVTIAIREELIGRERPPVRMRLGPVSDWSFPSAHTGNSTAFYAALLLVLLPGRSPRVRRILVATTVLLCLAIGSTRLVLTVHWPTDVLAAWALGIASAVVVDAAVSRRVDPGGRSARPAGAGSARLPG